MCRLLIAVATIAIAYPGPACGQDFDAMTLQGLSQLYVVVEGVPEEPELEQTLQTIVELRMREAGIDVIAAEEGYDSPSSAYVYVNANLLHVEKIDHYVYSLEISVSQAVTLARSGFWHAGATTWDTEMIGIIPDDDMDTDIRDTADLLMDRFLNAYLSVNPR